MRSLDSASPSSLSLKLVVEIVDKGHFYPFALHSVLSIEGDELTT